MWTLEPQPWIHFLTYPAMIGAPILTSAIPQTVRADWPGLVFLSVGGFMVMVMAADITGNVVMMSNKIRDNRRTVRMYEQPTEEEKHMQKGFIQQVVRDTVVTTGNTPIAVEKAPETVRKVPASFVAHQNTAEVVTLSEVDNAVRKVCRLNWMLIENGNPDGDFREATWVVTKKMTRKMLLLVIGILAGHGGIERKGSAGNSTWIVCDPAVIKRGAHTPLPHPIGCWCGCQAEK